MMKTMKYQVVWLLVLIALPLQAFNKLGSTAAVFLKINPDARAMGMAGAYVAVAEGPQALFWNPAGLVGLRGWQTTGAYVHWLGDVSIGAIAVSRALDEATGIAFGGRYLSSVPLERTTPEEPEGTGETFRYWGTTWNAAVARQLTDRVRIGIAAKVVQEGISRTSATTWALDFGSLYRTEWHHLTLGIALSHFGGRMTLSGQDLWFYYDPNPGRADNPEEEASLRPRSWALPTTYRVAVALEPWDGWLVALQGTHTSEAVQTLEAGTEYRWGLLALRAGLAQTPGGLRWTAGFGLRQARVLLDYAVESVPALGLAHRLGFTLKP